MDTDIVEAVQKILGCPGLTRQILIARRLMTMLIVHRKKGGRNLLTAVLAGLVKFTRSDNGTNFFFLTPAPNKTGPDSFMRVSSPKL